MRILVAVKQVKVLGDEIEFVDERDGIARAAIDELLLLAPAKRTPRGVLLNEEAHAWAALANAEALVAAARALCIDTLADAWRTPGRRLPRAGRALTMGQRARFRLAVYRAHRSAVSAVERVFHAAGTSWIKAGGRLDRCVRDVHAANQHVIASDAVLGTYGKVLFGFPPEDPTF